MRNPKALLISSLKNAGLRITAPREAICEFLSESAEHPTAAIVYERLLPKIPSMSLATVYNSLETLTRLGSINAIGDAGDNKGHFDADTSPHIHLACTSCHTISDLVPTDFANLVDEINTTGFKPTGVRIVVYGQCPNCSSN
jgi:Fur family peroxide stress response transcriptional regulator